MTTVARLSGSSWAHVHYGIKSGPGTPLVSTIAILILIVALVTRAVYLVFFHPLARFPGPKLWAISRVPWAYHVIKGDVWHSMDDFHNRYGSVIRIAPDELSFISPTAWKDIYGARPQLLKDPRTDSLFTAVGEEHRRIRGAFVNAFSDKALRDQSRIMEDYSGQFINRLKDEALGHGQILDIHAFVGSAIFDMISHLTWGETSQALQETTATKSPDWIRRFFLHARFSTLRNCLSRFSPLDHILQSVFLRVTARQRIANTKLTFERIDRRLAAGHSSTGDFMEPILDRITEDHNRASKGSITKSEVLTNGVAVVIANSQLGTIAVTTAIYLLLSGHPRCLRRLVDEVRSAGFQTEAGIRVASTQSLPYLNAVINETLRLHHPTPGSLPRIAPDDGIMIDGHLVPRDTVVGISLFNIHRRPENFTRPLEFHPERFLSKNDERYDGTFANDRLDAFQPFSMGPRNCIGGKVFLAQARVLLSRLLWTFDMELAEPPEAVANWLNQKAWLVYEPRSLRVKLTLRSDRPNELLQR
ncbi:cytochrome P450 [Aspergillus novofumigatus IBT 16806]|uniref:Cytochrome P450 monooxygenase-like protein n=1 Tax=Aspergillus novofumigatus (strain IBT 16806) TaxID=1392255 RepID=A0A2I1CJD8_ASPN1|nr:cytochrome P450 monooxygenase-like protein [Aspergillus novofumigatus IBT 16806]PKX97738.1 cytochrome P450 monooxygenase-like protein [Aspergillus novofumigatus IBT 16806]